MKVSRTNESILDYILTKKNNGLNLHSKIYVLFLSHGKTLGEFGENFLCVTRVFWAFGIFNLKE